MPGLSRGTTSASLGHRAIVMTVAACASSPACCCPCAPMAARRLAVRTHCGSSDIKRRRLVEGPPLPRAPGLARRAPAVRDICFALKALVACTDGGGRACSHRAPILAAQVCRRPHPTPLRAGERKGTRGCRLRPGLLRCSTSVSVHAVDARGRPLHCPRRCAAFRSAPLLAALRWHCPPSSRRMFHLRRSPRTHVMMCCFFLHCIIPTSRSTCCYKQTSKLYRAQLSISLGCFALHEKMRDQRDSLADAATYLQEPYTTSADSTSEGPNLVPPQCSALRSVYALA